MSNTELTKKSFLCCLICSIICDFCTLYRCLNMKYSIVLFCFVLVAPIQFLPLLLKLQEMSIESNSRLWAAVKLCLFATDWLQTTIKVKAITLKGSWAVLVVIDKQSHSVLLTNRKILTNRVILVMLPNTSHGESTLWVQGFVPSQAGLRCKEGDQLGDARYWPISDTCFTILTTPSLTKRSTVSVTVHV